MKGLRMEKSLLPIMRGKTIIVGIGNPLRGDDGFGPALIGRLQGKIPLICIDAGNAPENYLGRIAREEPDTVLLVDAAHLGLEPGQCRILQPEEILKCGLTTHDMSSRMLIEFLQNQTQADIFMLAVQPQNISLGEVMSECLIKTLDEIEMLILEGIHA
jgi:hydrogenase 3 maturation protease